MFSFSFIDVILWLGDAFLSESMMENPNEKILKINFNDGQK